MGEETHVLFQVVDCLEHVGVVGFEVQDLFDELLLWGVGLFVGWVLRSVLLVGRDIAHYNYLLLINKLN